ncbi:MAG: hypothetical protein WA364_08040 [Candidatus Nitrosopolaris sp.]
MGVLFYYTQYNESHIANSVVALISEYSYFPIFGLLCYRDNRHRYITPLAGKKDFKTIKTDVRKLLTALSLIHCQKYSSLINFYNLE